MSDIGWHPPAELSAWARAEAQRRNVTVSVVLTEALQRLRAEFESIAEDARKLSGETAVCPDCGEPPPPAGPGEPDRLIDRFMLHNCGGAR